MIRGLGIDLVDVRRVRRAEQRFGRRLAERLLHPAELADYDRERAPPGFLARRLAAKEAMVKALGTGFANGLYASQLRLAHHPGGQPCIHSEGVAAAQLQSLGVKHCHLTVSDERHYALACVVLEG